MSDRRRTRMDEIDAEMHVLADKEVLTDEEEKRWHELDDEWKVLDRHQEIRARTYRELSGVPDRTLGQMVDGGLRALEAVHSLLPADRQDTMERLVRSDARYAAEFEAHASPAYERAFTKLLQHGEGRAHLAMTPEEQAAMSHALSTTRAMSEGTTTAGGFGVPVAIDPSILMSAQGSGNPVYDLARKVDVTTNVWKPVSSAGASWSFDTEASEVSDDSPTLAQPTVTVFTARGFVPFSIEVEQDYVAFQQEMARLLDEGYRELLADKLVRGSGSGEPKGIITALDANTNVEVVSTTDGAFGQEDIYKVWKALPERFRSHAAWVMSVDVNNRIRQFGTANVYHAYTVALPAGAADELMTRPVYTSSYFPDFTATTGAENRLVVGDWSNYVVAQRAGMRVELIPALVGLTNNRPTGQRGLFAWARLGGNSVVDESFRLLQNQ